MPQITLTLTETEARARHLDTLDRRRRCVGDAGKFPVSLTTRATELGDTYPSGACSLRD
jgi:hypothetical protein